MKDQTRWRYESEDDMSDPRLKQKANKYRNITLSTMYFTHSATPEEIKVKISENHYRLCFSFHSSLSEVRFLTALAFRHIIEFCCNP